MMETDRQTTGEELTGRPGDEELARLQLTMLQYYLHETNPANGLIRDKTDPTAPSSIAAIGLGLATVPVLVERGVISREFPVALRRCWTAPCRVSGRLAVRAASIVQRCTICFCVGSFSRSGERHAND